MNKKSIAGMCVAALTLAGCGKIIPENDLGFHYTADYDLEDVANYTAAAQDGYFLFYKKDGTSGLLFTDDRGTFTEVYAGAEYDNATYIFTDNVPSPIQEKINTHQRKLKESGSPDFDGTYVIKLSSEEPDFQTLGFQKFEVPGLSKVVCNARIRTAGKVQSMKCQ